MKSVLLQTLRAALAVLLLAGAWHMVGGDAALAAMPQHLVAGLLGALAMATLFAWLLRRVRSEDRIACLEAALCREQNARGQADHALAEADLLLARLTAPGSASGSTLGSTSGSAAGSTSGSAAGGRTASIGTRAGQLMVQLLQVQAELAQLQQHSALDTVGAGCLARARDRLEQVARIVRHAARATESG